MQSESVEAKYGFLKELALELGASGAEIIPVEHVVVENRVVLKCRVGCKHYGKTLMCPPYSPSVEEFRKILNEYKYALVLKFRSNAEASSEVAKLLSKKEDDPSLTEELREKIRAFWDTWKNDKKELVKKICTIEKAAISKGYTMALGFTTGSCPICKECNPDETKICRHLTEARYTAQSVGVNVLKTLENAGMPMPFPFKKKPESFGMVLIE